MKKIISCKQCGNVDLAVEKMPDGFMHYSKLMCYQCSKDGIRVDWGKKPENENKRRDKNSKWKQLHKEQDGQFKCVWCGVDEKLFSDNLGWRFQCDHILPLSEGGEDAFENTQILCFVCHGDKTARRKQRELIYNKVFKDGNSTEV